MTRKFSVNKFFGPWKDQGANSNKKRTAGPRIPFGLQGIFIAANRGKNVRKPAPAHMVEMDEPEQRIEHEPPTPNFIVIIPAGYSLQDYLDSFLKERGYPTQRYSSLETGYRTKPTELQLSSYGTHVVSLVKRGDVKKFRKIMASGISPNPCNRFGESLLHMVCRLGSEPLLSCMLDAGSDVQVSDDHGRTPLHDSCWAPLPSLGAVELLVNRDRNLFSMTDKRGCTPLDYVNKKNWAKWIDFLDQHKDYWWPHRGDANDDTHCCKPPMADTKALSRQISDPKNALPLELAKLVAAGRMTPLEARTMMIGEGEQEEDIRTVGTASVTTLGFGEEDLEDSEYDSEDDTSSSIDNDEDDDDSDKKELDRNSSDGGVHHDGATSSDMDEDEILLRQVQHVLDFK